PAKSAVANSLQIPAAPVCSALHCRPPTAGSTTQLLFDFLRDQIRRVRRAGCLCLQMPHRSYNSSLDFGFFQPRFQPSFIRARARFIALSYWFPWLAISSSFSATKALTEEPRLAASTFATWMRWASSFNVRFFFLFMVVARKYVQHKFTCYLAPSQSPRASLFQRRNITDVLAKFLRLQQAPHDLPAARLRQLFRKRYLRRHGNPSQHVPHMVLQL